MKYIKKRKSFITKFSDWRRMSILYPAVIFIVMFLFSGECFAASGKSVVIAQKGDVVSMNPLLTSDYASSAVYNRIFNGLLKYDENMKVVDSLAARYKVALNQYITFDTVEIGSGEMARIEMACRALLSSNPLPDYLSAEEFKNLDIVFTKADKNVLSIRFNTFCVALCKLFESNAGAAIIKADYKPEFTVELKKGVLWHDGTPFSARDVIFTYETVSRIKKIPAYDSYNISAMESIEQTASDEIKIVFKYPTPRAFDAGFAEA